MPPREPPKPQQPQKPHHTEDRHSDFAERPLRERRDIDAERQPEPSSPPPANERFRKVDE